MRSEGKPNMDRSAGTRIAAPIFTAQDQADIIDKLSAPECSLADRRRAVRLIRWLQSVADAAGHSRGADAGPASAARPSAAPVDVVAHQRSRPSPHRESEGHFRDAPSAGQGNGAPLSRPHNEPTAGQKSAAASVKSRIALTVLDTFKVRGMMIGNVTYGEIPALIAAGVTGAAVLRQVQRFAANIAANVRIRDFIKPVQMEEMIRKARELADVA
jgi:hypothetical protein